MDWFVDLTITVFLILSSIQFSTTINNKISSLYVNPQNKVKYCLYYIIKPLHIFILITVYIMFSKMVLGFLCSNIYENKFQ